MTTLIPALGSCLSRMTSGEKRFVYRLEDDCLCWYEVSIGECTRHPDFVVFHPSRGLLVLEVKDWKVTTLQNIDKQQALIITDHGTKSVANSLGQARQYMCVITNQLERDPLLVFPNGSRKSKSFFPYGHGVAFPNITRKQFDAAHLGDAIPAHLVICQDQMTESGDAEALQQQLWEMFPLKFTMPLTLPQVDRIRWHIFPEVRIGEQKDLFSGDEQKTVEIPDILRVIHLQQEKLARSLGEGHRVIHGVAGSGKPLILGQRAEHLAKVCQRPILILCYNRTLATKLANIMEAKGLQDKVHAVNFHAWSTRQVDTFNAGKPANNGNLDAFFEACVDRVIRPVDQKLIPTIQYDAVMIDEGHDFKPEWFKLIVQMVNPDNKSLLVLYDDAQSIYNGPKNFAFPSPRSAFRRRGAQPS